MIVVENIDQIPSFKNNKGISIGVFDGVHLGHQYLLKTLRKKVGEKGIAAVFTFSNHPSSFFGSPIPAICTIEHKLKLLKEAEIDLVILQEFSKEFAETTYDQFLANIHRRFSFSQLVLGKGAAFGKKREGHEANVAVLGKKLLFDAEYLPKIEIKGIEVSSQKIRTMIREGNLKDASLLLGRPYSLFLPITPDWRFDLRKLCLPPSGKYQVTIKGEHFTEKRTIHLSCDLMIDPIDSKEKTLGSAIEIIFS